MTTSSDPEDNKQSSLSDCIREPLRECVNEFENKLDGKISDVENNLNNLDKDLQDYKKWVEEKLAELGKNKIPPGLIQACCYPSAPEGWLECNGDAVSREKYPELFKAIGTKFGKGDGLTTFNVPDLRGQFLRGYPGGDDDPKREFGSKQGDAIREIQGTFGRLVYGSTSVTIYECNNWGGDAGKNLEWTSGAFQADTRQGYAQSVKNLSAGALPEQFMGNNAKYPKSFEFKASNVVPTASENRPKNTALLFCIKT